MTKKQKRDLYEPEEFDAQFDGPSRSQLKRDSNALQQLGMDLAALGDKTIKEAGLPELVEKALLQIKKMPKHEAKRRHMQYVGKLMRTFDTTYVSEIVEAAKQGLTVKTVEFHRLEKIRERLVAGDEELIQEMFDTYPEQRQRMRQLILGARREQAKGKPPKDFRQLFKLLRELPPVEDEN